MQVQLLTLLSGARQARGLGVVIDVFRAFSVACYALGNGAEAIYPVADLDEAYALKKARPDWLLIGERDYIPPPGFDAGNSPAQVLDLDLAGRTLVHTTSAGTQGLDAASRTCDEVLGGSFVNASATVKYIRAANPEWVSIVAMGTHGQSRSAEDDLCGIYLKNALEEFPNEFSAIKRHLRTIPAAQKFFDPAKDYAPEADFELCLDLDRFDFALRCRRDAEGRLVMRAAKPGDPGNDAA